MHTALRARLLPLLEKFYDGNWYILGQELQDFETEYARFNEVRHCIGVANGLDALQIALRALDIGPGDEVIVPSNTYIASWLAVSNVGAIPVPVEPDPDTWNINPANIEAAITARTKAIMPVHLFGQACAMQTIMEIAEKNRLFVVEDNAQAHGALHGRVDAVEREAIAEALRSAQGNKSKAAQILGITRNGLALKMKRLKL